MHSYSDSGNSFSSTTSPTEPVPHDVRVRFKDFISGQPEEGWYERLDSSFRMRTGKEANEFFVEGRVFAMLHLQAASLQAMPYDENITVVKYGEAAYAQIRHFIVVEVRRGFVYACPVITYSDRGTLRHGCRPSEHSIVYLAGRQPSPFPGEYFTKDAIRVDPADPSISMDPASRIHYAKAWPVEMNVKVKDIGRVDPMDREKLLQYYKQENYPEYAYR